MPMTRESLGTIDSALRVLQTLRPFSCLPVEKPSESEETACLG